MAVIGGGIGSGLVVAWNAGDDCSADRLLSLQSQEGPIDSLVPSSGTVLKRVHGHDLQIIDVGANVFGDGATSGGQSLTSVSAPFTPAMVGLMIHVIGFGRRVVTSFVGTDHVTVDGPPLPVGTGRQFTLPLGVASFVDGQTTGGNTLLSASSPFTVSLVGTRISIADVGTRVVTAVPGPGELDFDGPPVPDDTGRRFNIIVSTTPEDSMLLTAGGKVIDSHRSPASSSPLLVRWRLGRR